jgi:hypothetical protein
MGMQRTSFDMLKFVYSIDNGGSGSRFALLPQICVLEVLACTQKYQFLRTDTTDLYTKNIDFVDKKNRSLWTDTRS